MALDADLVHPDAIFHSDRGTQYTSAEFARFCRGRKIRTSLGRTGVCWENAAAESFFAALKNEMYYRRSFPTRARPLGLDVACVPRPHLPETPGIPRLLG